MLRIHRAALGRARLIAFVVLVTAFSSNVVGAVRTIVLVGDDAVGTGDDANFGSFSLPSLNNRGQVAFAAQLAGADVSTASDTGYWIAGHGSLHSVIREGSAAPGMPVGSVFGNAPSIFTGQVPLNDAGDIAIGHAVTLPGSTPSSGLWVGNHQSLSLLAAQGSSAPGAQNDAAFLGLSNVRASLNRRGDVAFNASLSAAPYTTINSNNYSDGLWILNRNETVDTVLAGDSAPPLGEFAQIVGFPTFTYPSLNRQGRAAFDASHRLSGVNYQASIWVTTADGIELRGAVGQALPEVGDNAVLTHISQPGFNSAGTTVADGSFNNSGDTPGFGTVIMVADSAGSTLAAYSGGPAAGLPGYNVLDAFYEGAIGSGGHLAFYGAATNGTSSVSGVWAGRPDELQPVVLSGEAAPGANATFGAFFRNTPAVNRFGQVAFPAGLSDSQSGASSSSLWATGIDGNLVLVARTGIAMEVAEGDVRTVQSLSMLTKHGDDDGRPRGLNDLGQIVFRATFTDGSSGIFLSNAAAHLPGDYSGDGIVDTADYLVWRKAIATQNLIADGDGNGIVDAGDHALWSEFFGMSLELESGPSGAPIPEPSTAALAAMFCAAMLLRRRAE
jgi:hypothetical protein